MSESFLPKSVRRAKTLVRAVQRIKNWPTYLADYMGWKPGRSLTYQFRNGLSYQVRAGTCDRGILTEVWLRDDYTFAENCLKKGDIVIDLGAQAGIFSTLVAFKTHSTVYAYEPFPENYELLKTNIARNNLKKYIEPINLAVSDRCDKLPLYISDYNTGGHSAVKKQDKVISVDAITLDEVFSRNNISECQLLKVDVEGSEYKIFYNSKKSTLKKIMNIVLEYHEFPDIPLFNHRDLTAFIENSGFTVIKRHPYLYCFRQ